MHGHVPLPVLVRCNQKMPAWRIGFPAHELVNAKPPTTRSSAQLAAHACRDAVTPPRPQTRSSRIWRRSEDLDTLLDNGNIYHRTSVGTPTTLWVLGTTLVSDTKCAQLCFAHLARRCRPSRLAIAFMAEAIPRERNSMHPSRAFVASACRPLAWQPVNNLRTTCHAHDVCVTFSACCYL